MSDLMDECQARMKTAQTDLDTQGSSVAYADEKAARAARSCLYHWNQRQLAITVDSINGREEIAREVPFRAAWNVESFANLDASCGAISEREDHSFTESR